jgi:hypothetical protein
VLKDLEVEEEINVILTELNDIQLRQINIPEERIKFLKKKLNEVLDSESLAEEKVEQYFMITEEEKPVVERKEARLSLIF